MDPDNNHEWVSSFYDATTGLEAIIAIHSTALGPAAGGCRLWQYETAHLALQDALRLSKGMSYKNAMAGLKYGGGKAVIRGPILPDKRTAAMQSFGKCVDRLGGSYITAEDVGVTVEDMLCVAQSTKFVSGFSSNNGVGGDPSPYTARGVSRGIEAMAKVAFERSDLEGLTVAVQGLGGVGANLCRELHARGVKLVVSDIDEAKVDNMRECLGAEAVSNEKIHLSEVDVFAPCALGGAISDEVAKTLNAKTIAGGANNQVNSNRAKDLLRDRRILIAPDYVINAGGIIAATAEYEGSAAKDQVLSQVDAIFEKVLLILEQASATGRSPIDIADAEAERLISAA